MFFLMYTVLRKIRHNFQYSIFIMNVCPIFFHNRNEFAFPSALLLSCLFQTFAVLYGLHDLFLVVFTDVFLHLLPNRLADLGTFVVVRWCAIPLHLPAILSQLFGTCWQLVGILTFIFAGYWNGSFMNHLRSCDTPRAKIVGGIDASAANLLWILTWNSLLWCCNLPVSTFFRLGDHFFSLKLGVNPCFSSYHAMITHVETVDDWNIKEDVWPIRHDAVNLILHCPIWRDLCPPSVQWLLEKMYLNDHTIKCSSSTYTLKKGLWWV